MVKKKTFIIWGIVIVFLLALTIVLNTVAPMYDKVLRLYVGETEGKVDTSGIDAAKDLDLQYNKSDYSSASEFKDAEHAFAEEIAEEGIILLKNDGALPLDKSGTVDVWGYSSWNFVYNGTGSGGAGSPSQKDLFDGLTHAGLKYNTSLYNLYSTSKYSVTGKNGTYTANKTESYTYGKGGTGLGSVNYASDLDFTIFEIPFDTVKAGASVAVPKKDSVAVYTMSRQGGESADVARYMSRWVTSNSMDRDADALRHYLQPNSVEIDMLKKLKENYGKVVVLVNSGCAMEMEDISRYADAIVWCPAVGSHGTLGLGDLLAGNENFSGHLPDTLAKDGRSAPATQNMGDFKYENVTFDGDNARYVAYLEGIYVGYRYYETRYEDCVLGQGNAASADIYNTGGYSYSDVVAYPFGHGLSYTSFEWSGFEVAGDPAEENFTVKVTVKNTGNRAGKEVVQLYAQKPYISGGTEKASVELIGFAKTKKLEPQGTDTVEISFKKSDLKSYDYKSAKTYVLDGGIYYITAATDAHAAVNNILALKGKTAADGMTEEGNTDFVRSYSWTAKRLDKDDTTQSEITNRFAHADDNTLTYLSRSNWPGTYPAPYATNKSATFDSKFGDYVYSRQATSLFAKQFKSYDSLNPDQKGNSKHTYSVTKAGTKGGLQLIDMRGLPYGDSAWDKLLDQITLEELQQLIINSGLGTPEIKSINKPKTLDNDGPSGWSSTIGGANGVSSDTVYPSEIIVAGSFNEDIALRYGKIMGNSALYYDRNGWYAPGLNLHRTPFGGRCFEYYSEDVFLTGIMARNVVYGASSKGLITFMKHFALNEQDEYRAWTGGIATWANEQTIREIYLKPFEMAVKAPEVDTEYYEYTDDGQYVKKTVKTPGCMGIMTSFNRLGATWTGGNYNLLTLVLRGEWGFKGFTLTDFKERSYMIAGQEVFAGGDAVLSTVNSGTDLRPGKNDTQYYYSRQAAHNILYSIVNSNRMNGAVHGAKFISGMAHYEIILIVWDIVASLVMALGTFFIVWEILMIKNIVKRKPNRKSKIAVTETREE